MDCTLKSIENVYFVGIGGIGMSALARYFKATKRMVAGYDRTSSGLTEQMRTKEDIAVTYVDDESGIPEVFRDKDHTLVVYTPAVPVDSPQLAFFRREGFRVHKRSEVLGMLSEGGKALCIAGTHGKTTTSTLLAFLLTRSTVGCSAFLGGISVNFDTNLLIDNKSEYIVIEADEYDRSFLHLRPEMAVITAMDDDHLDIYHTRKNLLIAFKEFGERVRSGGQLFMRNGLELKGVAVTGYYGVEESTDVSSDNLRVKKGRYVFDYHAGNVVIPDLILGIPGRVNVENATAAITLALRVGVTPEEVRMALPDFRGVVRRFNIHTEAAVMYIDDYAHHPKEIEAVLTSVREMWPGNRITVAFQPHLYSRTKDFYEWFARSLSIADQVILLDIYPAREQPVFGVTSELIRQNLTVPSAIVSKSELPDYVQKTVKDGIFMTMGAGDIDRFVPVFTKMFETVND